MFNFIKYYLSNNQHIPIKLFSLHFWGIIINEIEYVTQLIAAAVSIKFYLRILNYGTKNYFLSLTEDYLNVLTSLSLLLLLLMIVIIIIF